LTAFSSNRLLDLVHVGRLSFSVVRVAVDRTPERHCVIINWLVLLFYRFLACALRTLGTKQIHQLHCSIESVSTASLC